MAFKGSSKVKTNNAQPQPMQDKTAIKAKFAALYQELEEKYLDNNDFYKNKLTEGAEAKFQEFTELGAKLATEQNRNGIQTFIAGIRNLFTQHKNIGVVRIYAMMKNVSQPAALSVSPQIVTNFVKTRYKQSLKMFFDQATSQSNDKELFAVVKVIKEHMPVLSAMTKTLRNKFPNDNIPDDGSAAWTIPNVHLNPNTPGFEGHYAQFKTVLTEDKAADYMAVLGRHGYHGKIQTNANGSLLAIPNLSQYKDAKLEDKIKNTQEDVSMALLLATLQLKTGMKWVFKNNKNIMATCSKIDALQLIKYFNHFSLKPQLKSHGSEQVELWFTDVKQEALEKLPFLKDFQKDQAAPKTAQPTKLKEEKKAEPSTEASSAKGKKIITIFGEDHELPKTLEIGDTPPKLGRTKPMLLEDALPLLGLKSWNESLQILEEDIPQVRSPDIAYGESINVYTLRNFVLDAKKVRDEKLAYCKFIDRYEPFCRMGQTIKKGELVFLDFGMLRASTKADPNQIYYPLYLPNNKEVKGFRTPHSSTACIQAGVEEKRNTDENGKPVNISLDDFYCSEQVKKKALLVNVYPKIFDYLGYPIVAYFAACDIKEGERITEGLHRDFCFRQNHIPTLCDRTGRVLEDANLPLEVEIIFPDAENKGYYLRKFQRQELLQTVEAGSTVGGAAEGLKEYSLLYFPDDLSEALKTPQWSIQPKYCWRVYKAYSVGANCKGISYVKITSPMLQTVSSQQLDQMQFHVPAKSDLPNKEAKKMVVVSTNKSPANSEVKDEAKTVVTAEIKDSKNCTFTWRYEQLTHRLWCYAGDRNDVITRNEYLFSKGLKVHPTQPGLTLDEIPMVLIDEPISNALREKLQSCLPKQEWDRVNEILQGIPREVTPVDVVYPPLVHITPDRVVQLRTQAANSGTNSAGNGVSDPSRPQTMYQPR